VPRAFRRGNKSGIFDTHYFPENCFSDEKSSIFFFRSFCERGRQSVRSGFRLTTGAAEKKREKAEHGMKIGGNGIFRFGEI